MPGVSGITTIYAAVIRSRSSGLTGRTPGWEKHIRGPNHPPLTFTATGASLPSAFCARAELKAIFTMAKRKAELYGEDNRADPVDGGLSSAAPGCDAVSNLVFDQSFRSLEGIRIATETEKQMQ